MGWLPAASGMHCYAGRWLQCALVVAAIWAVSGFGPSVPLLAIKQQREVHVSCRSRARGTDADLVTRQALSNALSRLLLGSRADVQQALQRQWGTPQRCETADGITLRTLRQDELAETGEHSKLDAVANLCTRGMFGEENEDGSCWVLKNFRVKYGEDSRLGRQSTMVVAETSDGTVIGCVGMELMLLTGDGMAWWSNPCSVIKKRPFVSDLVVDSSYRYSACYVGRARQICLADSHSAHHTRYLTVLMCEGNAVWGADSCSDVTISSTATGQTRLAT